MRAIAHQPALLPWAGFWGKAINADLIILMGAAKLNVQDNVNRVRLNDAWLTIAIMNKHAELEIKDAIIDRRCLPKIARSIENPLGSKKYPGREKLQSIANLVAEYEGELLGPLNVKLLVEVGSMLGIPMPVSYNVQPMVGANTEERLMNLLRYYKPAEYLSGIGGKQYLTETIKTEMILKYQVEEQVKNLRDESILKLIADIGDTQELNAYIKTNAGGME